MNKRKQLILSCLIMLVLLILLYSAVSGKESDKFTKLYVYNRDLSAGSIIVSSDISEIKIHTEDKLNQNYAKQENIEGKYIHSDVKSGQFVIDSDLHLNESLTVFNDLEPGNVLYTLLMKAEDVNGWWLRPGNIVDILIFDKPEHNNKFDLSEDNSEEKITLLGNLKVVRIMDENGNNIKDSAKSPVIICLEIPFEKAGVLFESELTKEMKIITGNKN